MMQEILDLLKLGQYTAAAEKIYLHSDAQVSTVILGAHKVYGDYAVKLFIEAIQTLRENNSDVYLKAKSEEPLKHLRSLLYLGKWDAAAEYMLSQSRDLDELLFAHVLIQFGANAVRLLSTKINVIQDEKRKEAKKKLLEEKQKEKDSIKGKLVESYEQHGANLKLIMADGSEYFFIASCDAMHDEDAYEAPELRWGLQTHPR